MEALGVDFGRLADQHEVDEILDSGAEKRLGLNRRCFAERDIDWELLEPTGIEVGANRVADGVESGGIVECRRVANLEDEEVAEIDVGGGDQMLGCRFLVVGSP